jgi:hypothetical protein
MSLISSADGFSPIRPFFDPWVAEDSEIRPRGLALDRIRSVGFAGVEMGHDGGGEVPAGGRAHHANALRVDLELLGVGTDVTNGAGGVL